MKKWFGLVLMGFVFCGATRIAAQGKRSSEPSLRVACNPLTAKIRIEGLLPSGDDHVLVDGKPVALKEGEEYILAVTMPGYNPYRKSFTAEWSGLREKSVILEKGIGPT